MLKLHVELRWKSFELIYGVNGLKSYHLQTLSHVQFIRFTLVRVFHFIFHNL